MKREPKPDDLIGKKEVARLMGVESDKSVDRAIASDDPPPYFRISGQVRFRRSEVLAWIESHRIV